MHWRLEHGLLAVLVTLLLAVAAFAPWEDRAENTFYLTRDTTTQLETSSSESTDSTKTTKTTAKSGGSAASVTPDLSQTTERTQDSFVLVDLEDLLESMTEEEETSLPESTPELPESVPESALESIPEEEPPSTDFSAARTLSRQLEELYGISVLFYTAEESEILGFSDAADAEALLQALDAALAAQKFPWIAAAAGQGIAPSFLLVDQPEAAPVTFSAGEGSWCLMVSTAEANLTYELSRILAETCDYLLGQVTDLSLVYASFAAINPADYTYGTHVPAYCYGIASPANTFFIRYAQEKSVVSDRSILYALYCSDGIPETLEDGTPVLQKLEVLLAGWTAELLPAEE